MRSPRRARRFGHRRLAHLQDLAAFTGADVITDETGLKLEEVEASWFGTARRVVITAESTTLVEGGGGEKALADRIELIRNEIARPHAHEHDREVAQERLAKLSSKLAVIRVGAATDVELSDRRRRVEGSLAATQAALAEGIVPGGGSALLRAGTVLEGGIGLDGDYEIGADIVRRVLGEPLFWIATNAGYDGFAVIDQVRAMQAPGGLNALTGEFGDLFELGVIVRRGDAADHRGDRRRAPTRSAGRHHGARVRRPGRGYGAAFLTDLINRAGADRDLRARGRRRADLVRCSSRCTSASR